MAHAHVFRTSSPFICNSHDTHLCFAARLPERFDDDDDDAEVDGFVFFDSLSAPHETQSALLCEPALPSPPMSARRKA
jgi:hypothetical protein